MSHLFIYLTNLLKKKKNNNSFWNIFLNELANHSLNQIIQNKDLFRYETSRWIYEKVIESLIQLPAFESFNSLNRFVQNTDSYRNNTSDSFVNES